VSTMDLPASGGKTAVGNLDHNVAALLCYMPFFSINLIASVLFLVTEPKESKLVRFHAMQSLMLLAGIMASTFAWGFVYAIVMVLGTVIDDSGMLAGIGALVMVLLLFAILFGIIAIAVFCMIQAFGGKVFRVPVIGQIADRLSG
jgi:uncharacterized membrane protein